MGNDRGRAVVRALDMGCGSGILAVAAAKLWGARVVACDNDAVAVALAARNAAENGVGARMEAVLGEGYAAPGVTQRAPFDLIAANILARPLIEMAPELARHLAPGGAAVLSGLLRRQEEPVRAAHARCGLALRDRVRRGEWSTLVLTRGAR